MRIHLVISLLVFSLLVQAEGPVYKKVNPDGSVEFSDVPDKQSEEIKVEPVPTTKLAPTPRFTPYQPPKPPQKYQYKRFEIVSPAQDETIRDNAGNVNVAATIEPEVQQGLGHSIAWYLDGKPLPDKALNVQLQNIDRGSHTLVAKIVDRQAEIIAETAAITFHLMRFFKKPAAPAPAPPPPAP